jgi:hypothetical protein
MKACAKFQAIILSLTTAIIILIWKKFGNQFEFPFIILFLSGGLISLATYRFLYSLLIFIFSRSRLFRMILLHKSYLEGTWVGFYIGLGEKVRFIKEEFKQDLDGLIIKGTGFNENKQNHATWISDITKIDERLGKLTYMYEVDPINENMTGYGVANFNLEYINFFGFSKRITGFSSDNHWGKRIKSIEVKISNKHNISDIDALKIAEKVYNENINNY